MPPGCQEMQEVAARVDPLARVWRGEGPPSEQGVRVLGIPIGHEEFVQAELQATEKQRLDLQEPSGSGFPKCLVALPLCATFSLRGVPPAETVRFAAAHDSTTWQMFLIQRRRMRASLPFQLVVVECHQNERPTSI